MHERNLRTEQCQQILPSRQGKDQHLRGSGFSPRGRRFRGDHGPVRIGQDDLAQPVGRYRPGLLRRDHLQGRTSRKVQRIPAVEMAGAQRRIHLPVLQSDADAERPAECRAAVAADATLARRRGARMSRPRSRSSASATAPSIIRASFPAASSSGSRSRGRSSPIPRCSRRRADRRPRSRRPPRKSSASRSASTASSARRSSW